MSKRDDDKVPWERENLWPQDLIASLGLPYLESKYGHIERRTHLNHKEVRAALGDSKAKIEAMIESGELDATDMSQKGSRRTYYKVYRYSVVSYLERQQERRRSRRL